MKNLIVFILLLVSLSCTTTKIVEVPVTEVRTEYINSISYDSIYIRDSVDRYIYNDTVYMYKQHTLYKYKYITDTICKIDSIPKIMYEETIVEVNVLKWYQKVLIFIGLLSILIFGFNIIKKL